MRKRATRSALGAAMATDDSLVTRSLVPASLDSVSLFSFGNDLFRKCVDSTSVFLFCVCLL